MMAKQGSARKTTFLKQPKSAKKARGILGPNEISERRTESKKKQK